MPTLKDLVNTFQQTLMSHPIPKSYGLVQHRWALIDCVAEIHRHYPHNGLDVAAQSLRYNRTVLQDYVYFAEQFPASQPTERAVIGALSYSLVRVSVRAARRTQDQPQSDPHWWINEALKHEWHSKELEHFVRQYYGKKYVRTSKSQSESVNTPATPSPVASPPILASEPSQKLSPHVIKPPAPRQSTFFDPAESSPDPTDPRLARALRVAQTALSRADHELSILQERIAEFNRQFAPFLGETVALVQHPLADTLTRKEPRSDVG